MASPTVKQSPMDVLNLEMAREADRVKVSLAVQQAGEMLTVRHVEELSVSMSHIHERARNMIVHLNQVNRQGHLSSDLLTKLKEAGQLFRDDLFSSTIKAQFNASKAEQLIITLDDQLVHLPWELLHDGRQFLSQRFSMGRVVRTRQRIVQGVSRTVTPPLQMLVLADPCGDLKSAYLEGIAIRDFMEGSPPQLQVSFRSAGVSPDFIKAKMRRHDIVHFAGHADYDDHQPEKSGWRLSNGRITGADIIRMAGTGSMPALIFSNACQSARTNAWDVGTAVQNRIFGLANAFILTGVKHYIGTFWEIPDETSRHFALAFYRFLIAGQSIGTAMRAARRVLIESHGEENIVWASYLLYGDPTVAYLEKPEAEKHAGPSSIETPLDPPPHIKAALRAPDEVIQFTSTTAGRRSKRKWLLGLISGAAIVLSIVLTTVSIGIHKKANLYEQSALDAFRSGNYTEVKQLCSQLKARAPKRSLCHLLLGNVAFYKGHLNQAGHLYHDVLSAEHGSRQDKAEALIGLGRISSEIGRTAEAIQYYRRAADLAPDKQQPYLAQALLLERQDAVDQAAEVLQSAEKHANSDDIKTIEALANRMRSKASRDTRAQRRDRIDRLIKELRQYLKDPQPQPALPRWSSRPLNLWLMDIESEGYSLQEGSSTLLTGGIIDRLLEQKRLQIVERDLLEELMAELKLSASNLTELQSMLSLGQLLAARLIVFSRMVHRAPYTQITMRCIETETGRVTLTVNETFDTQLPVSTMARRIAEELAAKIQKQYPMRAKVVGQSGRQLTLDIGHRHGVTTDLVFKGVDTDLRAKVLDVNDSQCRAQILAGKDPVTIGLRLEETQ